MLRLDIALSRYTFASGAPYRPATTAKLVKFTFEEVDVTCIGKHEVRC